MTPVSQIRALIERAEGEAYACVDLSDETREALLSALSEYAAFRDALDSGEMVERVRDVVNWGECETCGTVCRGYTECDCSHPIWMPISPAKLATAAIAAIRGE